MLNGTDLPTSNTKNGARALLLITKSEKDNRIYKIFEINYWKSIDIERLKMAESVKLSGNAVICGKDKNFVLARNENIMIFKNKNLNCTVNNELQKSSMDLIKGIGGDLT